MQSSLVQEFVARAHRRRKCEEIAPRLSKWLKLIRRSDYVPEASAYHRIGKYYYYMEDYPTAQEYLQTALKLDPSEPVIWDTSGRTYLAMNRPGKAVAACTQAIRMDPSIRLYYEDRAKCYCALKRYKEALADCDEADRANRCPTRTYVLRRIMHLEEGLMKKKKKTELPTCDHVQQLQSICSALETVIHSMRSSDNKDV